jgi:RNA polymerase sigma factor (sigma-70 family)
MGSEPEDLQLQRRLLARDELALAELYDEFSSTVFGVALQVTDRREIAEDVTRSVFVDLWRRPEWWDPALGGLRPWLAMVARHRSVNWIEGGAQPGADIDFRWARPDPSPAPALTAEGVRRELARLPQSERTPILLAYFGGRTYREVAADLGLAESVVKSQIREGLRRMDAALASPTSTDATPGVVVGREDLESDTV